MLHIIAYIVIKYLQNRINPQKRIKTQNYEFLSFQSFYGHYIFLRFLRVIMNVSNNTPIFSEILMDLRTRPEMQAPPPLRTE